MLNSTDAKSCASIFIFFHVWTQNLVSLSIFNFLTYRRKILRLCTTTPIMRYLLLFFLLLPFFGESQPSLVNELDQYIEQARQQWEVPGLAVAVVKDGDIVLSKGYGARAVGSNEKVDGQTLFAMASTTKATVAAAMGTLVDAGLVDWDDPVVEHLPEFRLSVPYLTQTARIRDLFTHNIGLGNADYLWLQGEFDEDEIMERIALAPMAYAYRGGYTYQNIMYLVAGKVIERVSGMPWAEFMQQRLYDPLGLQRTFPTRKEMLGQENIARPHHYIDGELMRIEDMIADDIAPAGASWSCTDDMARWMLFLLDSARIEGRPILKPVTWQELFTPQVIIPKESFYPTHRLTKPTWTTYGLGWFQHDYQGRAVQFHTGSLNGTIAICGLITEEKLGVYVFGNLDHAEVRHAIMYKVFDLWGPAAGGRDWSTEFKQLYAQLDAQNEQRRQAQAAQRIADTTPSLPLTEYTGTYAHPMWGHIEVSLAPSGKKLMARLGRISYADLTHWHFDTFQATYQTAGLGQAMLQFDLNMQGEVEALEWNEPAYRFTKTK